MVDEITRQHEKNNAAVKAHGLPCYHLGTMTDAYRAFPYKTHGGIRYTFSSFKKRYKKLKAELRRSGGASHIRVVNREILNSNR